MTCLVAECFVIIKPQGITQFLRNLPTHDRADKRLSCSMALQLR